MALVEYEEGKGEGLEPMELECMAPQKPRPPKVSIKQAVDIYGKRDSRGLVEQEKTKAYFANREIIRRLMGDPSQFKNGELNFIAGTAVDKVAKKERWDRAGDESAKSWTEQFVEAIGRLQGEGGLKLSLEVTAPGASRVETQVLPAIDVPSIRESEDAGTLPEA